MIFETAKRSPNSVSTTTHKEKGCFSTLNYGVDVDAFVKFVLLDNFEEYRFGFVISARREQPLGRFVKLTETFEGQRLRPKIADS